MTESFAFNIAVDVGCLYDILDANSCIHYFVLSSFITVCSPCCWNDGSERLIITFIACTELDSVEFFVHAVNMLMSVWNLIYCLLESSGVYSMLLKNNEL